MAATAGVWLFYVQHQFEDVYWDRKEDWDFARAAMEGSSFYKLPKILQWFSGNIGFHHIHHLSPRIPNYRLERAHNAEPLFQSVKPLTLHRSLKSFTYRLWDEGHGKLVGYKGRKCSRAKTTQQPQSSNAAGMPEFIFRTIAIVKFRAHNNFTHSEKTGAAFSGKKIKKPSDSLQDMIFSQLVVYTYSPCRQL